MKIAFRADASPKIGSGHIMRCLALADALRDRGDETLFVSRIMPDGLQRRLREAGHRVAISPSAPRRGPPDSNDPPHAHWLDTDWETDAEATLSALAPGRWDWLAVDHYALDARWAVRLRAKAERLLVIDDVADRPLDADLVLDPNLQPDPEARYLRRLIHPDPAKLMLGPSFALLRPEFASLAAQRARQRRPLRTLLIAFGGGDAHGATASALQQLRDPAFAVLNIIALLGGLHPARPELETICADQPHIELIFDSADVAPLMLRSDLAIGAGGGMTYERMCLGLPAILIALERNQEGPSAFLAERGLATYLGRFDQLPPEAFADAVAQAMNGAIALESQAQAGMRLVDGQGTSRVADRLHGVR